MLKERGGANPLKSRIDVPQEKALSFSYMGAPVMEIFSLGASAASFSPRPNNSFIFIQ
jgi:hypothetical protein